MLAEQWTPRLPSADELIKVAMQIYWEENPQATTNPEDYELKPPEGHYYVKARSRVMGGYVAMLEVALKAYREELEFIVHRLREIEKPVWPKDFKVLSRALIQLEEALR